jgi:hypothetical protein
MACCDYLDFDDIEWQARVPAAIESPSSSTLMRAEAWWSAGLKQDCPRGNADMLAERCDLICPDLPKVLL